MRGAASRPWHHSQSESWPRSKKEQWSWESRAGMEHTAEVKCQVLLAWVLGESEREKS